MIDSSKRTGLAGAHVVGSDGDTIGKIVDVYASTDTDGSGTFVTVATGLFGTGASFLPLDAAELRGDDVVVPYTKDVVKHAPRVDNDEELSADEEDRLFTYYDQQPGSATGRSTGVVDDVRDDRTVGHDTSGPTTDDAMTRSEERLTVGTETREAGRARLRKYVVAETQTRTVPVSHEEVRIQREPITDADLPKALSGPDLSEEHEVVLTAEQPVVSKETVPVERVRLGVNTVEEQETVTEQVRKEQIELREDDRVDGDPLR